MSRSGYSEDLDSECNPVLYRNAVDRAIGGKRGQAFLRQLAKEMDAMPVRELIAGELIAENGACCAIGVVLKARKVDIAGVDDIDHDEVGRLINVARSMAAEIAYWNDDGGPSRTIEKPEARWVRMRKWVADNLKAEQ